MNFEVLTLFPGMMNSIFGESIIGRAIEAGKISVKALDFNGRNCYTMKYRTLRLRLP